MPKEKSKYTLQYHLLRKTRGHDGTSQMIILANDEEEFLSRLQEKWRWEDFVMDGLLKDEHRLYLYVYKHVPGQIVTNKLGHLVPRSRGEKVATINFRELWRKYKNGK